ncbi:MAG: type IX secretion system sortase PorU [Bacteroidota bacterium]
MKHILLFLIVFTTLVKVQGQDFAANSVLNDGQWYKIGIVESGLYRLDQSFLSSLGINVAGLNPRQIQLFGNGGGMLPQPNGIDRLDDLVENSILVRGENDGSFDGGDQVIFYAQGPHTWEYNSESQLFRHRLHDYADTNYYYLRVGVETGKRVKAAPDPGPATYTLDQTRNFLFHEETMVNPMQSGRIWLGEQLSTSNNQEFRFYLPDVKPGGNVRVKVLGAARAEVPTFFSIEDGRGQELGTITINAANLSSDVATYYYRRAGDYLLGPDAINSNDSLRLKIGYLDNNSSRAEGWLDWIEVEYDQALSLANRPAWIGTIQAGVGTGQVAQLDFSGTSGAYQAWDLSDPLNVTLLPSSLSGGTLQVRASAEDYTRLAVFRDADKVPVSGEALGNQNLHALPLVDYLVITHPAFTEPAERLAQFHRDHYQRSAAVVTVDQILNEFSSGKMDPTAIRDFVRMQYLKSGGLTPGFVCLFGDGSYIYKYVSEATNARSNFVPPYQSRDSDSPVRSYSSDDFYGMMDEEDGFWGESSGIDGDNVTDVSFIDVAMGRLPIETVEQGNQIVDKIIRYATNPNGEDLGAWRNRIVLVGDYRENERGIEIFHIEQADSYTNLIQQQAPCLEVEKLFMDNYRMVVTAGAEAFPEGRKALLQSMEKGSLILNYTGHGGENAWSYASIFQNSDIASLNNEGRYPAVVTATCEYGRYDNPAKRSGGELLVMSPNSGAIALFTTGRLVYSSFNAALNTNFYRHVFTFDSLKGRYLTMGEVMMRTKNSSFANGSGTNINSRNFTLLGDPGLMLNYPQKRVRITHINDRPVDPAIPDTLRSLGLVEVRGVLEDEFGKILPDTDAAMAIDVFDKPGTYVTQRAAYTFRWQNNRIFRGQAPAVNSEFAFKFVVPIDISYENGRGKIGLYFEDGTIDGAGCIDNLYVGGTDPNATKDLDGPEVELFINDSSWIDGGITSPNPDLFAVVSDQNGINTTGNGIGREIIAVLDQNEEEVLVLNDYYQALPGSYQTGTIRYPLENLSEGEHQLRIRVWDVANNASEDTTTFLVVNNLEMALDQILFYPNPLDRSQIQRGRFRITHNQDGANLRISVQVMSTDGRVVTRMSSEFEATGNVYDELTWEVGEQGQELASGMYVFQVVVSNLETGEEVSQARKLVLIK